MDFIALENCAVVNGVILGLKSIKTKSSVGECTVGVLTSFNKTPMRTFTHGSTHINDIGALKSIVKYCNHEAYCFLVGNTRAGKRLRPMIRENDDEDFNLFSNRIHNLSTG